LITPAREFCRALIAHITTGDVFLDHGEKRLSCPCFFPQRADQALLVGIVVAGPCQMLALILDHENAAVFQLGDKVRVEIARRQRLVGFFIALACMFDRFGRETARGVGREGTMTSD
jgi:hypothetical protein